MRVLVTGGAGFIGTHLVRRLVREGCDVTVLDNLNPQVHGGYEIGARFDPSVRVVVADIANGPELAEALKGQDVIVHLAAETGTGQSMYAVHQYERVNGLGTARLLDFLVNSQERHVSKLVVASSRAIYGEGKYHCIHHGTVYPSERSVDAMAEGKFDPCCPVCNQACEVLPTDEGSPANPISFYGLTKFMQERSVLMFARTLGISGFALRYQNVYGPGQSLSNPYTGILAIFSTLARRGDSLNIFEDGRESRDFVYIDDVVEATWRCVDSAHSGIEVVNVGSGQPTTVKEVARFICEFFSSTSTIRVSGGFRKGDIRHNVADVAKSKAILGFEPAWGFRKGVSAFLEWASTQGRMGNDYSRSMFELTSRGLYRE